MVGYRALFVHPGLSSAVRTTFGLDQDTRVGTNVLKLNFIASLPYQPIYFQSQSAKGDRANTYTFVHCGEDVRWDQAFGSILATFNAPVSSICFEISFAEKNVGFYLFIYLFGSIASVTSKCWFLMLLVSPH